MTTDCKVKLGKIDKQQKENNYLQDHIVQGRKMHLEWLRISCRQKLK